MKLHIIRHARAVERSATTVDAQRGLTRSGRKRFRRVAAGLKELGAHPDCIITSPLVRAVQTAEILAETLGFDGEVQISTLLVGGPDPAAMDTLLQAGGGAGEIVLIGHEPELGEAVRTLLQLSAPCRLPKGSVVSLKTGPKSSGRPCRLTGFITGGGKVIRNKACARKRLLGQNSTA